MERLPGRNVVTVDDLPGPVGPLEDSVTTDHIPVDVVGQLEPEVKFVSESTTETITQPLAAQFPTVCEPSFPLKINMQTKMHFLFSHTSLPLQVKNLQRILLQKKLSNLSRMQVSSWRTSLAAQPRFCFWAFGQDETLYY